AKLPQIRLPKASMSGARYRLLASRPHFPLLEIAARAEQLNVSQGVTTTARKRSAMVEMKCLDCSTTLRTAPSEALRDRLTTVRCVSVANGRPAQPAMLEVRVPGLLVLI